MHVHPPGRDGRDIGPLFVLHICILSGYAYLHYLYASFSTESMKTYIPSLSNAKSFTGSCGAGSAAPGAVMGAATLTVRSTFAPHLGQNFD